MPPRITPTGTSRTSAPWKNALREAAPLLLRPHIAHCAAAGRQAVAPMARTLPLTARLLPFKARVAAITTSARENFNGGIVACFFGASWALPGCGFRGRLRALAGRSFAGRGRRRQVAEHAAVPHAPPVGPDDV